MLLNIISSNSKLVIFIMLTIYILVSFIFSVGLLGSDDLTYLHYSQQLQDSNEYVPDTHWGFRYTLLVPLSIFFNIFEISTLNIRIFSQLVAVSLLLYVIYLPKFSEGDKSPQAVIFSILLLSCPFIIVYSTFLNVDMIETLLFSAIFFYVLMFFRNANINNLYMGAALIGALSITRETSILYVLSLAIAFLIVNRNKIPLQHYLIIACISLLPLTIEAIYYYNQTGNFAHHISTVLNTHLGDGIGDMNAKHGEVTGNLMAGTIFEPLTAIFANHEYGFYFHLVLALSIALYIKNKSAFTPELKFGLLIIALSVLFVSYGGVVRLLARYFFPLVPVACFCIVLLLKNYKAKVRNFVVVGAVLSNGIFLLGENLQPIYHSINIAKLSMELDSCIKADKVIIRKALSLNKLKEFNSMKLSKVCDSNYEYKVVSKSYILETNEKSMPLPTSPLSKVLHVVGADKLAMKVQQRNLIGVLKKRE